MVHYLSRLGNNWQALAQANSIRPEKDILKIFNDHVKINYNNDYLVTHGKKNTDHEDLRKQAGLLPHNAWSQFYNNNSTVPTNIPITGRHGYEPDVIITAKLTGRSWNIEIKYGDTEGNAHWGRSGIPYTIPMVNIRKKEFYLGGGNDNYMTIFSGPMVTQSINPTAYTTSGNKKISAKTAQRNSLKIIQKINTFIPKDQQYLWMDDAVGCHFILDYFDTIIKPSLDSGGTISTMNWKQTNKVFSPTDTWSGASNGIFE